MRNLVTCAIRKKKRISFSFHCERERVHLMTKVDLHFIFIFCSRQDLIKTNQKYDCHSSKLTNVIPWLTFVFACLQIVKEFIQVIYQRLRYLKEASNWLEFILFITTILFMLPFLLCQTGTKVTTDLDTLTWSSAAVAILIGWLNFLIYLKHIPFFGLHVTMLEEVFKSLLNVFIIFVILVIAFALSFFSLVNVQESFQDPGMVYLF